MLKKKIGATLTRRALTLETSLFRQLQQRALDSDTTLVSLADDAIQRYLKMKPDAHSNR